MGENELKGWNEVRKDRGEKKKDFIKDNLFM